LQQQQSSQGHFVRVDGSPPGVSRPARPTATCSKPKATLELRPVPEAQVVFHGQAASSRIDPSGPSALPPQQRPAPHQPSGWPGSGCKQVAGTPLLPWLRPSRKTTRRCLLHHHAGSLCVSEVGGRCSICWRRRAPRLNKDELYEPKRQAIYARVSSDQQKGAEHHKPVRQQALRDYGPRAQRYNHSARRWIFGRCGFYSGSGCFGCGPVWERLRDLIGRRGDRQGCWSMGRTA